MVSYSDKISQYYSNHCAYIDSHCKVMPFIAIWRLINDVHNYMINMLLINLSKHFK